MQTIVLLLFLLLFSHANAAELALTEKQSFTLHDYRTVGGELIATVTVGYESWGTLNAARDNAILITHYFSGSSHAAGRYRHDDPAPGYWDAIIGPGKAIDTDRFFVIAVDTLVNLSANDPKVITAGPASINPATGKPYGMQFPVVQAADFVEVQHALLSQLGIRRLHAVAGPSGGSIQAMEWAVRHPDAVERVIAVISPGFYLPAFAIAELETWAQPIRQDPLWRGGAYGKTEPPSAGVALALRNVTLAAVSFAWMEQQFGRAAAHEQQPERRINDRFLAETELLKRGQSRAAMVDANHFLYTVRAYQLYDIRDRIKSIQARMLFIPARTDRIFPPELAQAAADSLKATGKSAEVFVIDGGMGHLDGIFHIQQAAETIRAFLEK